MRWILCGLLFLTIVSCSPVSYSYEITDVTKSENFWLASENKDGLVHSFTIIGIGSVVGKAKIQLILNGEVYKTEVLIGDFKFQWGGDWYDNKAEIRYDSGSVKNGKIELQYKFTDGY